VVDVVAVAAGAEAAVVAEVAAVVEVGKLTPPYGVVRAVPATPGVAAVCATEADDQNTRSASAIGDANLGKPVLRQLRIIINPRPIRIFGSPEIARGGYAAFGGSILGPATRRSRGRGEPARTASRRRRVSGGIGLMRIVVTGTSGAGKTTLSRRLATLLEVPHVELDAIKWQPGWCDLVRHDPDEFVRRVTLAIAAEAWVVDGNYGPVRDAVWGLATHLVWLDYERRVIMARVIGRTLLRAALRTELWNGNRERLRLHRPSHPIRWAWSTWDRRRREIAERLSRDEYAGLVVLRLRRPREAPLAIEMLATRRLLA
jgi:adenylate kinase family enzyme